MKISAMEILVTFYYLQAMEAVIVKENDEFVKSHQRFKKDFREFKNKFCSKAAILFRDYLVFASFSELCNSVESCNTTVWTIAGEIIHSYRLSTDILKRIHLIDLDDFVDTAGYIFDECIWDTWFGGPLWGKAVGYIPLYGKVPDDIFIDLCADLQHNSGTLFDKGGLIGETNYRCLGDLLDVKFKANNLFKYIYKYARYLSFSMKQLLLRFAYLYLDTRAKDDLVYFLFSPSIIKFKRNEENLEDLMVYEPIEFENQFACGTMAPSWEYRDFYGFEC